MSDQHTVNHYYLSQSQQKLDMLNDGCLDQKDYYTNYSSSWSNSPLACLEDCSEVFASWENEEKELSEQVCYHYNL